MMILAQTLAGETAPRQMTTEQHVMLAYAVAIVLLWGYAAWLFMARRRARRDQPG